MPSNNRKSDFFETEEGKLFEKLLKEMALDAGYNTEASYSANSELYPTNSISFVNKHKAYLQNHSAIDPQQYLSNLRLITRIRK